MERLSDERIKQYQSPWYFKMYFTGSVHIQNYCMHNLNCLYKHQLFNIQLFCRDKTCFKWSHSHMLGSQTVTTLPFLVVGENDLTFVEICKRKTLFILKFS